jgi:hypothetical protein
MPISKAVADFTGALEGVRAEISAIGVQIAEVESERQRIAAAPPHTDDIVAVFLRGLQGAGRDFEQQLAAHLRDTFTGSDGAAAADTRQSQNLLHLEPLPDREARLTRTLQAKRGMAPDINLSVLTWLLGDQIAEQIPALVDKLCPAARSGMKVEERRQRLGELDENLARLRGERDALVADLNEARKAAYL